MCALRHGAALLMSSLDVVHAHPQRSPALAESVDLPAALLAHALDPIVIIDACGVMRFATPAVQRVLGRDADVLVGTELLALIHPDDVPAVGGAIAATLADAALPLGFSCRMRGAHGAWRWI